ncbi:peptidase C26, gamma-glutamyl hydrolase, partial [Kipferlia bialata]
SPPEKSMFEWTDAYMINHSYQAILVLQQLADTFVHVARYNCNDSDGLMDIIIYNYNPTYTGKEGATIEQQYFFSEADTKRECAPQGEDYSCVCL